MKVLGELKQRRRTSFFRKEYSSNLFPHLFSMTAGRLFCCFWLFAFSHAAWAENISSAVSLGANSGMCAVGAETGKIYAVSNANKAFSPASIQKLLITSAALHQLGAMFSAKTEVLSIGHSSSKTPVLILRAGLDPAFTTERVFLLGRALKSLGVKKVGELVFDDSPLIDARERQGTRAFLSAVSAFGLNWNTITARACATDLMPGKAIVTIDPFEFPTSLRASIKVDERQGHALSLSEATAGGRPMQILSGAIGHDECMEEYAAVDNTRSYTAAVVRNIFEASGMSIDSVAWKRTPKGASKLIDFASRPLEDLLKDMNYFSNNNMAEMMVGLLGEDEGSFSRELGLRRVVAATATKSRGIFVLKDASGLSPANQVTPQTICDVLKAEYADRETRMTFFGTLPQLGTSGTMKKRLGTANSVLGRAKTGSLADVSSLAGLVYGRSEPILFAIIQNQVGDLSRAKDLEDRIVTQLSRQ